MTLTIMYLSSYPVHSCSQFFSYQSQENFLFKPLPGLNLQVIYLFKKTVVVYKQG